MATAWNFERRKVTCDTFLVGVSLLTKGCVDVETSLEAVRARVSLPSEDALFAARRLDQEGLLVLEARGAVRSTAAGIARAAVLQATEDPGG